MSVTIKTNLGDLKCEIFCDRVPKTAKVSQHTGRKTNTHTHKKKQANKPAYKQLIKAESVLHQ
jgi:hypothetical protein